MWRGGDGGRGGEGGGVALSDTLTPLNLDEKFKIFSMKIGEQHQGCKARKVISEVYRSLVLQ